MTPLDKPSIKPRAKTRAERIVRAMRDSRT